MPKWEEESARLRATLRLHDRRPWTASQGFKGHGLPHTRRVKDLLDVCFAERCKQIGADVSVPRVAKEFSGMQNFLVDVSQSHSRRTSSNVAGEAPCLTTSSQLYSFKLDRALVAYENLLLQGWPPSTQIPACMSEEDVRDLAGEGIALPCLGLVVSALLLSKSFP